MIDLTGKAGRKSPGLIQRAPIILASASPRRFLLLSRLGLRLKVIPSGIEEGNGDGESPREHVLRLASEKARLVAEKYPDCWVVGADTIVFIEGRILGKPHSPDEAREMLGLLSGRGHQVYTAYAIVRGDSGLHLSSVVESTVIFREITPEEMSWYVATKEPYDKAGAYAVQGRGAFFIKEIRGSYTNVMGLPLSEVVDALKGLSAIEFS